MKYPMTPRSTHSQRGVAAVELAIVSTLLILLLAGGSELGRAIFQYNTVVKGARAAVRYLSLSTAGNAAAITAAKCLAVRGTTDCTGTALVPGLTTGMVSVCDAANCAATHFAQLTGTGSVDLVTVTITGLQFQSLLPGLIPSFNFEPVTATMRQD